MFGGLSGIDNAIQSGPMADGLGAVIAQMRAQVPPVPYATIAAQLGISIGKVQRELAKFNHGANGNGSAPPGAPLVPPFDPELQDYRRGLELDRIKLARQRLEVDRAELDHRMALLSEAGKKGGDSAMWALVMGEINRLRESIAHGPAAGSNGAGIIDELSRLREVGEIVKAMAPPPAMSGREGVEFNIALERIRQENERILREKQAELENRRIEIEGQAARDHALAKLIEGLGPVAARAAEKWVETRTNGAAPAAGGGVPPALPEGTAAANSAGSGRGHCPRCGYPPGDQEMELVPSGGEDKCPGCSANLTVLEGRIALAGAAAGAAPPAGSVAQPNTNGQGPALPTFTS